MLHALNPCKMAKIGYIMVTEHYERLEEDRSWMNDYGCVQIIEERDADEKQRPLWKQLMTALELVDELGERGKRHVVFHIVEFRHHGIFKHRYVFAHRVGVLFA